VESKPYLCDAIGAVSRVGKVASSTCAGRLDL